MVQRMGHKWISQLSKKKVETIYFFLEILTNKIKSRELLDYLPYKNRIRGCLSNYYAVRIVGGGVTRKSKARYSLSLVLQRRER